MVSLLPAYATSNVIANLKSSEVSSVMIMIAGLGASYILYLFLDLIIFFLRQNVEKNARTYLKKVFMRKLFEHQEIQTDTSKITEILYTDVNNVINLLFIFFDLGINVLFAMLLGAMLFFLSWKFASIVLVTTCISLICTIIMRRKVKEKEVAFRTGTDYHFKLIRDIIQNMRQIKTSNSVDSHLSKYENNLDNVKMVSIGKERLAWLIGYVITIFEYSVLVCLYYLGVKAVSLNVITMANLLLFLSYSKMFSSLCNTSLKNIVNVQKSIVSVERALPFLNYHLNNKNKVFPEKLDSIKVEHIDYSYGDKDVFIDFNLEVEGGQCAIIIGKNGSGKTTLLNILAALNITSKGNIYFNDISINDIAYESMQESITYYTQDDILFDQSIKDNILSFKNGNEVSSEALQDICMRLGILDDIFNLDDGFDTLLSEYKTLSLGQKKKLLFARAFLKPSQVLLLDEPLSGLDKLSQGIVLNMIEELKGKKTIIIATHRPELFSFCDKMINI